MNRINQEKLIALRMGRGLAVRQLARDCGIEIAVLNRLETAADPSLTTLSVAAVTRLADRLGVPVGYLFTTDQSETNATPGDGPADTCGQEPDDPASDAAALGALLTALTTATSVVALSDGLGWTTHRVHAAAAALDAALRPAGMTVFKNSGTVQVRPADDTHTDAELAVRRHPRARGKQRLVNPTRARLLHRAAHAPISPQTLSVSDRIQIATLVKAGVLIENSQRCFVPSLDVIDSLNPTSGAGTSN